jgi:glycosyltransferase involved in cell wall biosynthesis
VKVAIVCDWLVGTGGAERVVLEFHKMFPNAPIYTSQYNRDPKIWYGDKWFADADVRTTWLQNLPLGLRKFLPTLRAGAFSHMDLSEYNLVISSSGAEAKAIKTGKNTKHVCYMHAPTHYYWARYDEYLRHPGFGALDPLARLGLKVLVGPMRRWDKKAAQRPDFLIANSTFTQKQIKKYYDRDSVVIFPPVDVARFNPKGKVVKQDYFLAAGRQTPYKRIDLAVAACTKLNLPLKVIGNGPDHERLVKMAGPTVEFLTNVSDIEMVKYFQETKAFIFPGVDDFGIVAAEALAAGTPVIAYKEGGALDYVVEGKTGVFFDRQTPESLAEALESFKGSFSSKETIKKVSAFSTDAFQRKFQRFIVEA